VSGDRITPSLDALEEQAEKIDGEKVTRIT
jgi:hypothetical protein